MLNREIKNSKNRRSSFHTTNLLCYQDIKALLENDNGAIRLKKTREYFGLCKINNVLVQTKRLNDQEISWIIKAYKDFRDLEELMPLRLTYKSNEPVEKFKNIFGETKKIYDQYSEWQLMETIKRGNKKYCRMVKERLDPLTKKEPIEFFSTEINENRKRKRKTNVLYLTGTVDTKKITLSKAWLNFGKEWNSFINNIKQQFGNIEYIRTWQSTKNGYPHFHAIVYIDFDFNVIPWEKRTGRNKGRITWRIDHFQRIHKKDNITCKQRLQKAWKPGNLDIIAVSDLKKTFKDLIKYVTRDLKGKGEDITNAMAWYFGKRTYSITKNFVKELWGEETEINTDEPCNSDLITGLRSNSNYTLTTIEIFPILKKQDIEFPYQKDILEYERKTDPPPHIIEFLEKMSLECEVIKVNNDVNAEKPTIIVYGKRDF